MKMFKKSDILSLTGYQLLAVNGGLIREFN